MSSDAQGIGVPSFVHSSRFLIVTMGGRLFAVDASVVQGLLTLDEVESPDAPEIHGVIYRRVDLTERLALEIDSIDTNARWVLMAEGDLRKSIRVGSVHGLMELPLSRMLPLPPQFTGPERFWYRGLILFQNSVAPILNTRWMFGDMVDLPSEVRAGRSGINPEHPVIKGGTC